MDKSSARTGDSRFASVEEVMSQPFMDLVRALDKLTVEYQLPDHSDVNLERYPWSLPLLSTPALYAARTWEYPFALLNAELSPRMRCADVGCGMTAFTVYLKQVTGCHVIGVDPDVFDAGIRYKGHGVSREFIRKTGLQVVQSGMEELPFPSATFDRVFCLSVIEHLPADVVRRGVQEIARILKPEGRAILTVDVNLLSEISRPLELIWDSGLLPMGSLDLRWPPRRFGIFCDGKQPADVYGMTLIKDDYLVETQYCGVGGKPNSPTVGHSLIPTMRWQSQLNRMPAAKRPLWKQFASRAKRAWLRMQG